ncbi:hypothetical protein KW529_16755 [Vibrio fluvialis]|nr:hypothetical protein [Vibrio fluvialis]
MEDKTFLEQANTALAEAREVMRKSVENLEKSKSINEVMMVQNRRLGFALSSLLPKPYLVGIDLARSEQELVMTPILEPFEHRDVYDVIHAINVLAMANTDILNINTQFRGCSRLFIVRVRPLSAISPEGDDYSLKPVVYREEVSLVDGFYTGCPTGDCQIERLLRIESQLTELIIEAREQAEAKAEVNA